MLDIQSNPVLVEINGVFLRISNDSQFICLILVMVLNKNIVQEHF